MGGSKPLSYVENIFPAALRCDAKSLQNHSEDFKIICDPQFIIAVEHATMKVKFHKHLEQFAIGKMLSNVNKILEPRGAKTRGTLPGGPVSFFEEFCRCLIAFIALKSCS